MTRYFYAFVAYTVAVLFLVMTASGSLSLDPSTAAAAGFAVGALALDPVRDRLQALEPESQVGESDD